MKKISRRSCVAACATLALLASGSMFLGNKVHAAANEIIYLKQGDTADCYLYDSSSTETICDAQYGTYDAANSTLTIGEAAKNANIRFVSIDETKTYTIKAATNIETNLSTLKGNYIFDIGNHTWTIAEDAVFTMPQTGSVLFKSGTYNISNYIDTDTLKIEGATINMLNPEKTENGQTVVDMSNGSVTANSFIINSGSLSIKNNGLRVKESMKLQNGSITITNKYGIRSNLAFGGTSASDTFEITGGSLSIDSGNSPKSGINFGGNMKIAGGTINISNSQIGIEASCDSKIAFNDGTTTIKNSSRYAFYHKGTCEKTTDTTELEQRLLGMLTFGDGMGIKEPDLHIFLENESSAYGTMGIVAKNTLTIAKGYDNRKVVKGWEIGYGEPEDENIEVPNTSDKGIKAPNTGSMDTNHKTIAIVATAVFMPISLVVGYLATKLYNRRKNRVNFNK